MKYICALFLALFAVHASYADGILDPDCIAAASPSSQSTTIRPKPQAIAPQYGNRFGFSFDRLVYERTKTDAMYFGLDVWACIFFSHSRHDYLGALLETEARVGYNLFYDGRDHFTPLAGAGYMYNNVGQLNHAKFAYVTAGFLYSHEFNTVFGWGINLKGIAGQQVGCEEERKFAWGVDLCMPIIFRFAHYRHWDVSLEPFYLYMETNHIHQGVFGGRGTIGYRF